MTKLKMTQKLFVPHINDIQIEYDKLKDKCNATTIIYRHSSLFLLPVNFAKVLFKGKNRRTNQS